MNIFGDIGNSETKIFLVDNKYKIKKRFSFPSKKINRNILQSKFRFLIKDFNKIEKILFCSVVPNTFNMIKKFLKLKTKKKCYEIKDLNLEKLIDIKVNFFR